jgi:hypothetical protein
LQSLDAVNELTRFTRSGILTASKIKALGLFAECWSIPSSRNGGQAPDTRYIIPC